VLGTLGYIMYYINVGLTISKRFVSEMANTPPSSSRSYPHGTRNPRVARRDTRSPRASPYPTHLTLSDLAARVRHHDQQLHEMDIELQETREQWRLTALERINEATEDHENTVNNMNTLRDKVVEIGADTVLLRLRLEECEQRSQRAEEYARELVQRLVLAEDNARQASRLANTVDHLVALMEQINLR
jgi:hypothetical protein